VQLEVQVQMCRGAGAGAEVVEMQRCRGCLAVQRCKGACGSAGTLVYRCICAEVQRSRVGEVQRCSVAEVQIWSCDAEEVVQRWCRCGTDVVQRWGRCIGA
jgi:hypothetical protein